jgi:gliding motility-associated-like protein
MDTFRYVMGNNGTPPLFDTATVYMYVCIPPHPIAVNDDTSCTDTAYTTYVDVPDTLNILANDTLFPATDTLLIIMDSTTNGHLYVTGNYTVIYAPDSGYRGNDHFTYKVCEIVGDTMGCSNIASVCINIVDTSTVCFFPNGISPNGDGVNDFFVFQCNDKYPNATLRVFNRWGDAIWQSKGNYQNDWGGTNMLGTPVPDGTYYFVYQYNDGSNRATARFVVVHR